jgi:type II secretory pathway pseudopilin PulG
MLATNFMSLIFLIFLAFIILAVSAGTKNNSNNMNNNAKYAFYYLLSLVALIFTALSVGMIAFGIIGQTVPDPLNVGSASDGLKFAISALLIATPIFYFMQKFINKGLVGGELEKDSGVRRWLTYFILLVSSVTILGVFIGIINSFLAGELTLSFILKALSMIIISAAVFSFYFYDIKREDVVSKNKVMKIFFIASLALIIIAFVASWFFIESPMQTRAKRLDQNLVNNITGLENAINSYNDKYKVLPDTIDQIKSNNDIFLDPKTLTDPETGAPIVYQKTGLASFQFCATFKTDNKTVNPKDNSYYDPTKLHQAGYQCIPGQSWNAGAKGIPVTPTTQAGTVAPAVTSVTPNYPATITPAQVN